MARRNSNSSFGIAMVAVVAVGAGLGYFVFGRSHHAPAPPAIIGVQEPLSLPAPSAHLAPKRRVLPRIETDSDYTAPGAPHIDIREGLPLAAPSVATPPNPPPSPAVLSIPTPDAAAAQSASGQGTAGENSGSPAVNQSTSSPSTVTPPGQTPSAQPNSVTTDPGASAPPLPAPPAVKPPPSTTPTVPPLDTSAPQSNTPFYLIQAGIFGKQADAQSEVQSLEAKGIPAAVSVGHQGGAQIYRVQVGAFHDRTTAEKTASTFRSQGVPVTVTPDSP